MSNKNNFLEIIKDVYLYKDTCNVYLLRDGDQGILVDFGSGDILEDLDEVGVNNITNILITHHHRDQVQGLKMAVDAGIKIYVPHMEQDFFIDIEAHWQGREIYNNYDNRQDRFSLLNSIEIDGTLKDYSLINIADFNLYIHPTPGHSSGAITIIAELSGGKLAFTGDLIYEQGKVWSMAATQWTYNGLGGVAATVASLLDLKEQGLDLMLPSHGNVIDDPEESSDLLIERFWQLLQYRKKNPRIFKLREEPYEEITGHLLRNRTSMADAYVLLSDSGKALLIDFGYDFMTGFPTGTDRDSRRPKLYTLDTLKKQYQIDKIDVVIPTHYHDDHVAGFNLLRDIEGTEVWAPENFASILEEPTRYNLPCLWYDPITVDRKLPLAKVIKWEEHELTLYEFPGHTHYAVAISFEVDGKKVVATSDQYEYNGEETLWNYVYMNRYCIGDFPSSAKLLRDLNPDILLTGHWGVQEVDEEFFRNLLEKDKELARLHDQLLPHEEVDFGREVEFVARIEPYQLVAEGGSKIDYELELINPFADNKEAIIDIICSDDRILNGKKTELKVELLPGEVKRVSFQVNIAEGVQIRRARIAADITIGDNKFGQQAEALITVNGPKK